MEATTHSRGTVTLLGTLFKAPAPRSLRALAYEDKELKTHYVGCQIKLPDGVDHRGKLFRHRRLTLPSTLHTCLGATAGCFGLYGNQVDAETANELDRALRHKARSIGVR